MFFRKKNISPDTSDEELIALYKKHSQNHYAGILFQRYSHLVFGVCLKYLKNEETSKDAVMQVFEKLLKELKVCDVKNFKSWLHVVTRNHCLMYLRSSKNHLFTHQDTDTEFMENVYTLHHTVEDEIDEEDFNNLQDCIEKLPEEQRICLIKFFYEDMCYKAISQHTGYDLKKVKSSIQNGKRNLKNCMQKSRKKTEKTNYTNSQI